LDPELNKYLKLLVKLGIIVLFFVAVYLLIAYFFPIIGKILSYLPSLILPFIFALLMAIIVEPIVVFFEKRCKLKRAWASAVSLILLVGGSIYIISWMISKVIKDLMSIFPNITAYSDQTVDSFLAAVSEIRLFYLQLNMPVELQEAMQDGLQQGIEYLSSLLSSSIDILTVVVSMLPEFFIFLMIAAIATFLITNDRYEIKRFLYDFIPSSVQNKTSFIFNQLGNILLGFIKAYTILISITAVLTMILLKIIGVDYILTVGIVVGLLDLLPILGPGILFIPWVVVELILGNTSLGMGLLVIYLIISLVRQFMEPKVVGDKIGLHPLVTLIALYVGLQLGGAAGLILGPVTVVIIIASYRAGLFDRLDWRNKK